MLVTPYSIMRSYKQTTCTYLKNIYGYNHNEPYKTMDTNIQQLQQLIKDREAQLATLLEQTEKLRDMISTVTSEESDSDNSDSEDEEEPSSNQ